MQTILTFLVTKKSRKIEGTHEENKTRKFKEMVLNKLIELSHTNYFLRM